MANLRPVYSVSLLNQSPLLSGATFTCPTNARLILRDIDACARSAVSGDYLIVHSASFGYLWVVRLAATQPTATTYQWQGRQVFSPGETCTVNCNGAWDIAMSGYELALP